MFRCQLSGATHGISLEVVFVSVIRFRPNPAHINWFGAEIGDFTAFNWPHVSCKDWSSSREHRFEEILTPFKNLENFFYPAVSILAPLKSMFDTINLASHVPKPKILNAEPHFERDIHMLCYFGSLCKALCSKSLKIFMHEKFVSNNS